jgi:predicted HD phosphohydrolase
MSFAGHAENHGGKTASAMDRISATALSQITEAEQRFRRNYIARHLRSDARYFAAVEMLSIGRGETPTGLLVDNYTHSLQAGTRALRDGADSELVVAALLHDCGNYAAEEHGEIAATILRPYINAESLWLVRMHAIFQDFHRGFLSAEKRHARDMYRGHPAFEQTALFCERYDENSFDPRYDTLPIDAFVPHLNAVFYGINP